MIKNILYFIVLLLIGCGEDNIDIDFLKKEGYRKAECRTIERVENYSYSIIDLVESLKIKDKDIILARCYDYNKCTFVSKFIKSDINIICQRYIIKKFHNTKKDIHDTNKKVLDDHTVLYLIN